MKTQSFKDLVTWQKAADLAVSIYGEFKDCKDFSFRDQIQRATISISNNVAEGYAKRSDKAFRNFLMIAKGSCAEVESMLLIAHKLGYISEAKQQTLLEQTEEVGRLLSGFVRKLPAKDY
ncbi:four helix bundle protein [Candidatus Saccharibacteria bacterium]|nr:four helix bundle protein [Candidatus Saccharibacteria bacterium]